jgi:osmotically-inducible protein OsmY
MIRGLVRLILLVIVVVAIAAFFMGYRWGIPGDRVDRDERVGTTGAADVDRNRAREAGAEIGEKVADGASAAQRALANAQLTAKIKSKMALDDAVPAASIDVDSAEGVVTLSGRVRSEAERERAVRLARETDGVSRVVDRLRVQ